MKPFSPFSSIYLSSLYADCKVTHSFCGILNPRDTKTFKLFHTSQSILSSLRNILSKKRLVLNSDNFSDSIKQSSHSPIFFLLLRFFLLGRFLFLDWSLCSSLGLNDSHRLWAWGQTLQLLDLVTKNYLKKYPDSSDKAAMFLKALPRINGTVASIG